MFLEMLPSRSNENISQDVVHTSCTQFIWTLYHSLLIVMVFQIWYRMETLEKNSVNKEERFYLLLLYIPLQDFWIGWLKYDLSIYATAIFLSL